MSDRERPLSYWVAVARMGFENDLQRLIAKAGLSRTELAKRLGHSLAYVSKFLNRPFGNYQLDTMAQWARAVGAIVQIRLVREGEEAVRVVDYDTAAMLDAMNDSADQHTALSPPSAMTSDAADAAILPFKIPGTALPGKSAGAQVKAILG